MKVYACMICGYEYNTENGDIENGLEGKTEFEDISEDWVCPLCGASKDDFELISSDDEE